MRVDVHILDHNGNLADAASLSALAALLAFRRPEVTLEAGGGGEGQQVVVHPPDVREPLPLSIHHTPLCITFASFQVTCCTYTPGAVPSLTCILWLVQSVPLQIASLSSLWLVTG